MRTTYASEERDCAAHHTTRFLPTGSTTRKITRQFRL